VSDDGELMAKVQQGDQAALEMLFTRWERPLFAYFYRLGTHPNWVEDLVEETLVTLYRQRTRFDVTRPFAPWLYGVARIVWKDHHRHQGRTVSAGVSLDEAEGVVATEPDALDVAEREEERERIRAGVETLSAEQRETFILRHYHGLSYEEIAGVVGAPLGTVKWRILEAVLRLARALGSGCGVKESRE
jgi:RNA polymerase sigma-70 factor (ECF subfamily)